DWSSDVCSSDLQTKSDHTSIRIAIHPILFLVVIPDTLPVYTMATLPCRLWDSLKFFLRLWVGKKPGSLMLPGFWVTCERATKTSSSDVWRDYVHSCPFSQW